MTSLINRLACLAVLAAVAPTSLGATIVQGRTAGDIYMSGLANAIVTIVSVTLPAAGQYSAVARASIVNWTGLQDNTRCAVSLNSSPADWAVTTTGGQHAPSAAGVTSQAEFTTTTPNQVVSLQCYHDNAISGIKVDGGAELVVSDALPGAKGAVGLQGLKGYAGPRGAPGTATISVCASVNPAAPTSQSCSCSSLSHSQYGQQCSASSSSGTCTATGLTNQSGVYNAACCVCNS